MDRMLAVMSIFSLMLIVLVLLSVRRAHIRVEYSVSWLAAAVALLILSRWRDMVMRIPAWLGVSDAALAVLIVAGGVFIIVLYRLSMIISHLKDSNIALIQKVAILEFNMESLHEKNQAAGQD
jgi:hypothetical protein